MKGHYIFSCTGLLVVSFFAGLAVKAQQVTGKQTAGVFPPAAAGRAIKNAFETY